MPKYVVTIQERLEKEVEIKASSKEEAEQIIEDRWCNSDYILGGDNYVGVTFTAEEKVKTRDIER